VTLHNDEFVYAAAYVKALRRSNTPVARRIADDYLRYMDQVFTSSAASHFARNTMTVFC